MNICNSCKKENSSSAKFCIYCGKPLAKKTKEKETAIKNSIIEGAATETVQRYGSAVKEHLVAYTGKDNQYGIELKKGLKKISKSKINPEYEKSNLLQQAGFSAEDKYTARQNAANIINKNGKVVHNTDIKGSGSYNQLFDHVITDKNGNIIAQEQMKFVGSSPRECLNKLLSDDFQKYFDADATITISKDYYEGVEIKGKNVSIFTEIDKDIKKIQKQLDKAKLDNNKELQEQLQEKINKLEKVRHSVKNSGITKAEAMEARLHPELSTAKDIGEISLQAGKEQAIYGGVIGGSISIIQNCVALIKGEKNTKEVALSIAGDTVKASAISFATGFTGSAIKGAMQNSSKTAVRALSKTNLAGTLVTTTVETGKTLKKYITGKISGLECLEELGEKGTSQLSAAMFAIAGQVLIPIPVVGGAIGSMVGYALSSACYKELTDALKEAKLAKEERIKIEKECQEAIVLIRQYRAEMNAVINNYLSVYSLTFNSAFEQMHKALELSDIDGFIGGANKITEKLNGKITFHSFAEFEDKVMNTYEPFKL